MADAILAQTVWPYFVLQSGDGRFVTNDRRSGPFLTPVPANAYCWKDEASAEACRPGYQTALGVSLCVVFLGERS